MIRRGNWGWMSSVLLAALVITVRAEENIIFNEIHYSPDVKTEQVEFIELYNRGSSPIDLSGWTLSGGVEFTIPQGTTLAGGGYLVLAQNSTALRAKYGASSLGPWTGRLDNHGEKLVLRDSTGRVADEVEYQLGFPWPTVGAPPGYSIELVNPSLDNDLGGSWRASTAAGPTGQNPSPLLVPDKSAWKYFKGTREASTPATEWRLLNFDDSSWLTGTAPLGYGENIITTPLGDMQGNYTSVFFRKTFDVSDPATITSLQLDVQSDDGMNVWINGALVQSYNMPGTEIPFNGTASTTQEGLEFKTFTLTAPANYLVAGKNQIAVQAHNISLAGSSDFVMDLRLTGKTGAGQSSPTPGARNISFNANIPPQIRQVQHEPEMPRSQQPVRISAKISDPDGIKSVELHYQVVEPGSYIELADPAYQTSWTSLPMNDAGTNGDKLASDGVFSVELPAGLQVHRRLIRYRLVATDNGGRSITAPYADDPEPNFAYFVYDGVPGWRGAVRPGTTPVIEFSPQVMGRLPTYHLISKKTSVERSTWIEKYGGDLYKWKGTLVYDGKVYDHIGYRARGGVWRYAMGKNMWKFDFNRGHDFQARDNYGRKFKTTWTKLNLGASIQQGDYQHRGEQGMFESVGLELFNLAGVEAPRTTFVTFRIIDDAVEANPSNQFDGDFWGVYLAVEQEDSRFLDEHDLPDGNFYKMESGTGPPGANGELNNQGATAVSDYSDLISFQRSYTGNAADSWYRQNLDLNRYYSYQAIVQGIHHYDICCGKNYFYYRNPVTGLWQVHPWDLDLTWADNMYVGGVNGGTEPFQSRVLPRAAFNLEYKNRIREIRDLLFNNDQAWKVIDEYAALLRGPTNGPTILDADRSQWDYNPVMVNTSIINSSKAGQGRFYQAGSPTKDFAGMVQSMKDYVVYRSSRILDPAANDNLIPNTPTISAVDPENSAINRLQFRSSAFSGGSGFASIKWRVGEISDPSLPAFDPNEPRRYEIAAVWESGEIQPFSSDITIPPAALKVGHRYRVRAQMKDATGRTSHWSPAVEFTAAAPDNSTALQQHLRVTEVMHNPPAGNDFEFIELHNTSPTLTLDLGGVAFTQGIEFSFAPGTTIAPDGYLLVVKADAAGSFSTFRNQYGLNTTVPIVGPYTGSLNNDGERVTLKTAAAGADIADFTYGDGRGWPPSADGAGHSLVPLDSAVANEDKGSLNYPGAWRASTYLRGSPGRADPPTPARVLLNEIMAHTDFLDAARLEYDSNDWLEILNGTSADINLAGWYLSDDPANLKKWAIPATSLSAGGLISFDEISGFHNPITTGFGLDKAGEQVFLSFLPGTAEDRVVDSVRFKGQANEVSLARVPDGGSYWYSAIPTRNQPNKLLAPSLVISEIMYHPSATATNPEDNAADEFVEITNTTTTPLPLFDTNGVWRLDGGVQFLFPSKVTLPSGGALLLVNFSPTNETELNRFRNQYNIAPTIPILGPYQGKLNNSTDRVAVERPQFPDLPADPYSWIIVDEVIYGDQAPWPAAPDGTGPSLHRVSIPQSGNDPANWKSAPPTPGMANQPSTGGDSDGDGIPDDWETAHGLNPNNAADAATDADKDGLTNFQEFRVGTDPRDPNSTLTIQSVRLSGRDRILRVNVVANHRYVIEYKDFLASPSWTPLKEISPQSTNGVVEITDAASSTATRFYRLVAY